MYKNTKTYQNKKEDNSKHVPRQIPVRKTKIYRRNRLGLGGCEGERVKGRGGGGSTDWAPRLDFTYMVISS